MKFHRRAAIIGACVRLHNFCIDKRIDTKLRESRGLTEYQPDRWARAPETDKDGRPLKMLKTKKGPPPLDAAAPAGDRFKRRNTLIASLRNEGLTRPAKRMRQER